MSKMTIFTLSLFHRQCSNTYQTRLEIEILFECWEQFCKKMKIQQSVLCLELCVGLSPDLQSMEQIRRIMRPTDVPDQGLLCDLLWSDPDKEVMGWGENDRGVSFTFGAEVVAKFLHKHGLDLICRAHQVSLFYLYLTKSCIVTMTVCLPTCHFLYFEQRNGSH